MFTIGNFTAKHNPVMTASPAPATVSIDTWTARLRMAAAIAVAAITNAISAIPRRLGDRLFAMNDNEAYWRGWQIIKLHGGLGRRYRDPAFGSLVLGITAGQTQPATGQQRGG